MRNGDSALGNERAVDYAFDDLVVHIRDVEDVPRVDAKVLPQCAQHDIHRDVGPVCACHGAVSRRVSCQRNPRR